MDQYFRGSAIWRTFLSLLNRLVDRHPTSPATEPGLDVAEVIRLINVERSSRNLQALVHFALLSDSAQDWAETMARNDTLEHGNFPGRMSAILPNTAAGEDIGEAYSPGQIVTVWMKSPKHMDNILGRWNVIGVGLARSKSGTPYWCADFDMTP